MKRLVILILFTLVAYVVVLTCVVSCANMGSGPDGGPYDETPPRIVSMTAPSQVASGAATSGKKKRKTTKFSLSFSELVTIDNPMENVIVSPPQIEMPNIQAVGKKINVELIDSLKPNTTYTVDFSDAIKDNNEGNPLGHFTYIFSTGEVTDTMEMSGYVLNAEDLEPVAGILVGLHPVADGIEEDWIIDDEWHKDTLFTKTPFDRVARTDGSGYFSIKGVKDGRKYHAYALKDSDGDFAFSARGEQIAFLRDVLTPSAFPDTRYDTLWIDSTRYDSIRVIPYTHYMPDDITLLAFQEANQPRFRLKDERSDLENFKIWFTAPSKHVPVIHGINFDERGSDGLGAFVEQRSAGNDTLVYWLRDTLLMQQDTLRFVYDFMMWDDSLQQHVLTSDSLELVSKTSWKKRLDAKEKEDERWQKQLEKRHKRGDYSQEERPIEFMKLTSSAGGTLPPNKNITLTFDHPVQSIDEDGIHLMLMVDSIGTPADYELDSVPNNILARELRAEWRPDQKYSLVIDSAAIHTIYGRHNNKLKQEFSIENLEKFGTYFVTLTGLPDLSPQVLHQGEALAERKDSIVAALDSAALTMDSLALVTDSLAFATDSISLSADSIMLATDSIASVPSIQLPDETSLSPLPVIVQLLDRSGKVMYSIEAVHINNTSVRGEFYYLKEGTYYLRCIVDANANGKWDPGIWADRISPEDVFYFNESVEVRAGWDINADWDVQKLPRYQQKPTDLVKQKKSDKGKSSAHERNIKRLEDRKNGGSQNKNNSSSGFGGSGFRF